MKAISLWQPWASLWLSPAKIHETRHWPTRHRGWLLVHAAKRKPDPSCEDDLDAIVERMFGKMPLPLGALIGMVYIEDCVRTETVHSGPYKPDDYWCGDFSDGRFAWRRSTYQSFDAPIPYRGSQGFFDVDIQEPAPRPDAFELAALPQQGERT